jgi:hypothetical protein
VTIHLCGDDVAIQSIDNLITAMSSAQTWRFDFNKVNNVGLTGINSFDLGMLPGNPVATTYPGTALAWKTCTDITGDGTNVFGMYAGGNVSPSVKNLLSMSTVTTSGSYIPATIYLVDVQGYYPSINLNSTASQTLTGSPSLRYTNGAGLRMYLVGQTATGSTPFNLSYSYTNQSGTSGRVNPYTVSCAASKPATTIIYSGANNIISIHSCHSRPVIVEFNQFSLCNCQ